MMKSSHFVAIKLCGALEIAFAKVSHVLSMCIKLYGVHSLILVKKLVKGMCSSFVILFTFTFSSSSSSSFTLFSSSLTAPCFISFAFAFRFLCIVHKKRLSLYSPNGDVYSVALPCEVVRVWPLLEGIILERDAGPLETTRDPAAPTLFSLMHPLEDIKPIATFVDVSGNGHTHTPQVNKTQHELCLDDFVCDPLERVVYACGGDPFIVTYSQRTHTHRVWILRQSSTEVKKRIRSDTRSVPQPLNPLDTNVSNNPHAHQTPARKSTGAKTALSFSVTPSADVKGAPPQDSFAASLSNMSSRLRATPGISAIQDPLDGTGILQFDDIEDEDGLADDEAFINSEIIMQCAWSQDIKSPSDMCSSAFLAADISNCPLLCLHIASTNTLLGLSLAPEAFHSNLTRGRSGKIAAAASPSPQHPQDTFKFSYNLQVSEVFRIPATAAVPIRSGRNLLSQSANASASRNSSSSQSFAVHGTGSGPAAAHGVGAYQFSHLYEWHRAARLYDYDILVLSPNHEVRLYNGAHCMCTVHISFSDAIEVGTDSQFPNTPKSSLGFSPSSEVILPSPSGSPSVLNSSVDSSFGSVASPKQSPSHLGTEHLQTPVASSSIRSRSSKAASNANFIVGIRDAVSNRVTVVLRSGALYRAELTPLCRSPLVHACLASISCTTTPGLMHQLRCDYVKWCRMHWSVRNCEESGRSSQSSNKRASTVMHDVTIEWEGFCSFLCEMVCRLMHVHVDASSAIRSAPKRSSSPSAAWDSLMSDDTLGDLPKEYDHILRELRSHDDDDDAHPTDDDEMKQSQDQPFSTVDHLLRHASVKQFKFTSDANKLASYVAGILQALHLVYEDLKLNVLSYSHANLLAQLLVFFTTCVEKSNYTEHYIRDFGSLQLLAHSYRGRIVRSASQSTASTPTTTVLFIQRGLKRLPAPANIHSWLQQCVLAKQGSPYPLFPPSLSSPCELSRKICHFYDLLTRDTVPTADSRYSLSAAEQLVTSGSLGGGAVGGGTSGGTSGGLPSPMHNVHTPQQGRPSTFAGISPVVPSHNRASGDVSMEESPSRSVHSPFASPQNQLATPASQSNATTLLYGSALTADQEFPLLTASRFRSERPKWHATVPAHELVRSMVEEHFGMSDIECLPFGVALPLREALRSCRYSPPTRWPAQAFLLVGREDITRLFNSTHPFSESTSAGSTLAGGAGKSLFQHLRPRDNPAYAHDDSSDSVTLPVPTSSLVSQAAQSHLQATGDAHIQHTGLLHVRYDAWDSTATASQHAAYDAINDPDGTLYVEALCALRFGRDRRLKEVRRLLTSTKPVCIRMPPEHEMAGRDVAVEQQQRLARRLQRSLAQCIGRGMFTLASVSPVLTDLLPIPELNISGRIPPSNRVVSFDDKAVYAEALQWPQFHNGVAAGLRIVQQHSRISRTWIVYNRPREMNHQHAGFLFALGLQGHLNALANVDCYWYLTKGHDATTAAVLLGLAAAKRGSQDTSTAKVLCMHIPVLLPPGFATMEISYLVQTAAVLGIGLLHQGSANRLMTEVLLAEIGRRPTSDSQTDNREAYSLAAGLSLGLVCLARGGDSAGLADLHIEDRLTEYIEGGRFLAASGANMHGLDARRSNAASAAAAAASSTEAADDAAGGAGAGTSHCSRIREGEMVNVEVTAPGATMALGLMFLKTNNHAVAARLSIPSTHFALEYVSPEFIMLRVISRNLIMWDSVEPSSEWINKQVPPMIHDFRHHSVDEVLARGDPAHGQAISAADIDLTAIRQAYCFIVAGASMSVALRFAGSQFPAAREAVMTTLHMFRKMRSDFSSFSRLYQQTIETCLSVSALAVGIVMAGSGHLDTFRVLRSMRFRVDKSVKCGHHMAMHMAIGMLFLGGGRHTFNTSNESLAALVCSIFPRFPLFLSDNTYHLQMFRHLYVLAAEPRCIETRDVDTGLPCYVPLDVTVKQGKWYSRSTVRIVSPGLLPEFDKIAEISVSSPRYWPVRLQLEHDPRSLALLRNRRILYVKRKTGYLLYQQDPKGLQSILSRSFPKDTGFHRVGERAHRSQAEFVRSFSADPNILSFAKHFCVESTDSDSIERSMSTFATNVLYECLTREKPEMLHTYLAAFQVLRELSRQSNNFGLWNLKLIVSYYKGTHSISSRLRAEWSDDALIQAEFVAAVETTLDSFFEPAAFTRALQHFVASGDLNDNQMLVEQKADSASQLHSSPSSMILGVLPWQRSSRQSEFWRTLRPFERLNLLGCFLTHLDVPQYNDLQRGIAHVQKSATLANIHAHVVCPGDNARNDHDAELSARLLPIFAMTWRRLPVSTLERLAKVMTSQPGTNDKSDTSSTK
jgi:Anaphase-promoting complex sub unit 1 C-terminal domain/APC1 beta sandwich domain/Anaphase-promoting complex subunit 1 middle domain